MSSGEQNIIRARLALDKADLSMAQKVASVLERRGFDVVHIGTRGIGFEGHSQLFTSVFGSEPFKQTSGYSFRSEPQLPDEIADIKASVYFPTKPTFYK